MPVPRARRWVLLAAAACAVAMVALLVWALRLRQDRARLATQLRYARRGARPALPPPAGTDAPEALKRENARLRRELEQATVPQVNVPTVGLGPGQPTAEMTAGQPALMMLTPPARAAGDEYRLRVLAYDGGIVWEGSGLRPGPGGALSVIWPGSLAEPGDYRLELFGPAPSDRRLGMFHLTVRADEAAGG